MQPTTFDLDLWQAGGVTSFSQTPFAEYWSTLPSIVDTETTAESNGVHVGSTQQQKQREQQQQQQQEQHHQRNSIPVVDAYNFRHRAALEKHLIENTGGETVWGNNFVEHWLWGYVVMLDWQKRSGRFEDPSTWEDAPPFPNGEHEHDCNNCEYYAYDSNNTAISRNSWWGYMNCILSVGVYCGAAEAGIVPPITLSDPSVGEDPGFRTCVGMWKEWWETDHVAFVEACSSEEEGNNNNNNNNKAREKASLALYASLWKIHNDIVRVGVEHSTELQDRLPEEDRNVGLGWCNMLEFLSATNWPLLSLESMYRFGAGYLPTLRIAGPNTLEWMRTHKHHNRNRSHSHSHNHFGFGFQFEHRTVASLHGLVRTSEPERRRLCEFFRRVSRWGFARNNLPRTLHVLTHGNPIQKCLALARALVLAAVPMSGKGIFSGAVAALALALAALGGPATPGGWWWLALRG